MITNRIAELASLHDSMEALADDELFARADQARREFFGNRIELCAIINIRSGACGMDCKFCAQSRHNQAHAQVYGLLPAAELRRRIDRLAELPIAHIGLVASGAALGGEEFGRLLETLERLPENTRGRLCASLGTLDVDRLEQLGRIGIRRYHHNLETSRNFYPEICKSQTWDMRRETAAMAMKIGLELCSGCLFGLGESWADRLDLALTLRKMGVQSIPMNFLDPIPGTPLGARTPVSCAEALRIIAVFRLVLQDRTLRVCGGRLKSFGGDQAKIFSAGANALMTGDFLTTKGGLAQDDLRMLEDHGLINSFAF